MRIIFVSLPVLQKKTPSASANAVIFHDDQYLYIFLAHVRYSAVYCNSFQCAMAVGVFPEKESSLL